MGLYGNCTADSTLGEVENELGLYVRQSVQEKLNQFSSFDKSNDLKWKLPSTSPIV